MDPGERPPGAADGIERCPPGVGEPADVAERFPDQGADPLALRHRLVEPQRPERQGRHIAHPFAADPDKFQAAAAQIADDALRPGEAGHDAIGRKPRLVLAAQDPDLEAWIAPQRLDEGRPVRRLAHRRRREGRDAGDLHGGRRADEPAEIFLRPGDAVRVEPAAGLHAAAEPAHHFLVEDRRRRAGRTLEHHKADRIGADIDDRDPPPEKVIGSLGVRNAGAAVGIRAGRQHGDSAGSRARRGRVFNKA